MDELPLQRMMFKDCVKRLGKIWRELVTDKIGWLHMERAVQRILGQYFRDEDREDVLEGFCRLLKLCDEIAAKERGADDTRLAHFVLDIFYEYIVSPSMAAEENKEALDKLLEAEFPTEIFQRALQTISKFSKKHLTKAEIVLRLRNEAKMEDVMAIIMQMLSNNETVVRGVEWICHFGLREHKLFQEDTNAHTTLFKEMVCILLLCNREDLLEEFIGPERYRQKELMRYLDKLVGMLLSKFAGNSQLETRLLDTERKAEKAAARYFNKHKFEDELIPNLSALRCLDALMYNHRKKEHGEMSHEQFEDIALQAMKKSTVVRNKYVAFLSGRNEKSGRLALYFALYHEMHEENFPDDLKTFIAQQPGIVDEVRMEVERTGVYDAVRFSAKWKKRVEKETEVAQTFLFGKFPIHMVEDNRHLLELCKRIKAEKVVGIDSEWKPNFESMREQLAIIQIATADEIFIVDVVLLESRLDKTQWMEFYEALLCSSTKKIGFALNNDFRVIKSHFPYVADELGPKVKNAICLRSLLAEVNDTPAAARFVFEGMSNCVLMENSLYEVAKRFAGIELNKDQRESNWLSRPLRSQQLQYAALDAFCLVKCFNTIVGRLNRLEDREVFRSLRKASLVHFKENKLPIMPVGNPIRSPVARTPRETEAEFLNLIEEISREVEQNACGEKVRSVAELKLVVDSMFFGLGEKLRKCGFDVKAIGNRQHLRDFCLRHPDFYVITTGKAYKELQVQLETGRCLCIPVNTDNKQGESRLIAHVCRQLRVVIRSEDMFSRCMKCNQRATFARIPKRIFKVLFYDYVKLNNCDWMVPDIMTAEKDLHSATQEMLAHASPAGAPIEDNEDYAVHVEEDSISCECKDCSVDITNQLLLHREGVAPARIKMTKGLKKELFDHPDVHFEVCTHCGKLNKL